MLLPNGEIKAAFKFLDGITSIASYEPEYEGEAQLTVWVGSTIFKWVGFGRLTGVPIYEEVPDDDYHPDCSDTIIRKPSPQPPISS